MRASYHGIMKRAALLTLALLALPAFATWHPVFSPRSVSVAVGDTEIVFADADWSGFSVPVWSNWHIYSSDPAVAAADVIMVTSEPPTPVPVTGIAPGTTSLSLNGDGRAWVSIEVYCRLPEPAVQAGTPVARVHIGDDVDLVAVSSIAHRSVFTWYEGRIGDTSRPLSATGSVFTFTPKKRGAQYVWVRATTPCSTSNAEFRIEAEIPKRRAVRK